MRTYLDILSNVYHNGVSKQPVRFDSEGNPVPVENGTRGVFCEVFRHHMRDGFPLLTTKKMPIKTICVELEGFIQGVTDKQWYKDRGCRIWNEWANPVAVERAKQDSHSIDNYVGWSVENHKRIQEQVTDLGPIYGYQWRYFGGQYGDTIYSDIDFLHPATNGVAEGADQLKTIADRLRENPYDRRMVCSAWNPNQINMMALPPCHFVWNVVVYGDELNLVWHQRSCDVFLGVPFNIASYAILLKLLAAHAGLKEGELVGTLNDCHLYDNQLEQAEEQLRRTPNSLPELKLTHDGDIFNWTHEDVELVDYSPQETIKAEVTV